MNTPTLLDNEITRAKTALRDKAITIQQRRDMLAAAGTMEEKEAHQKHLNDYLADERELTERVAKLEAKRDGAKPSAQPAIAGK